MKKLFKDIGKFFSNIKGFIKGWHQLKVSQRDILYSFYGFNHFNFAKKYADKRQQRNGLKHWVVPAGRGAEQLVVFNTVEKKQLQRSGLMSKKLTVHDMLKAAYYFTPNPKKNK